MKRGNWKSRKAYKQDVRTRGSYISPAVPGRGDTVSSFQQSRVGKFLSTVGANSKARGVPPGFGADIVGSIGLAVALTLAAGRRHRKSVGDK